MKKINTLRSVASLLLIMLSFGVLAQREKTIHYVPRAVTSNEISSLGTLQITAKEFSLYQIDLADLAAQLVGIGQREDAATGFTALISFPHPDGTMHQYQALANRTLSAELSEKFPEINTYDAIDTEGRKVKWDITPKGLHVMILQPNGSTIFIDPAFEGNNQYYLVYYKKDFTTDKLMTCDFDSDNNLLEDKGSFVNGMNKSFGTCELRTYRLALSATGEYTAFHGGTVGAAQAAQATTMNRVNGVFERDMAITMTIIGNNNLLIYTNSGTDPYTNGNPGNMINQNQSNVTTVIGSGNYDIGHVFGTNSGGLAGLGVVCSNSNKARGVTGSSAPIGDPFDIDYVAHEMGHQFGANHTQNNNCNRNNATAMEPGSASTIMGYAGVCSPNIQPHSDDHFHGISLQEIGVEILSSGHQCEQITPLLNAPPSITGTNGNVTVPAGTPFALSASVFDPDGDQILYCWEQMDNAVSTQPPVASSGDGPNFRSFSPSTSPTRYFPNLVDLAAGISPTWEVIPTVTRTMNFRLTVRDQGLNVPGCNDHEDVSVSIDAGSGPFIVLYPSTTGIVWTGTTSETVTWDVASTNLAPVNCATVDVLLSIDGGLTYPYTLASGAANDGSETISVPNVTTTTARVMVMNSNGPFFDISDNDFEIAASSSYFSQNVPIASASLCQSTDATYTIQIGSVGGYTDPVTLSISGVPAGASTNFSVNPVTPGGTSVLTISNTASVTPGAYSMTVTGTSTSGTELSTINLSIYDNSTVVNESVAICEGETYTYPDGNLGSISETHTSILSSVNGCDSTVITTLSINIVDASVSFNPPTLMANSSGAAYQWIDCETNLPIAGATSQSFVATNVVGTYAVIVSQTGCSDTSNCYTFDQTAINNLDDFKLNIYPNPTNHWVDINWQGNVIQLILTDARGRVLNVINTQEKNHLKLDINSYANGLYFIHMTTNQGTFVKELVKN